MGLLLAAAPAAQAQTQAPTQTQAGAQTEARAIEVEALYLEFRRPFRPPLSNLARPPADSGLLGARLALKDNAGTGRFLGHRYNLETRIVAAEADVDAAARAALEARPSVLIVNGSAAAFRRLLALAAASPAGRRKILVNAGSPDTELRRTVCHPMVFHTLPSRAMLTDALLQFLVRRRWTRLLLVTGRQPGDRKLAASLRRSAGKFGARIVTEKPWLADVDIRRTAGAEVPRFTQGVEYDILAVADEDRDFGRYFLYNSWLPRPVALSHGLQPTAWSRVVEQWGAAQLQRRFRRLAKRDMNALDYAAWAGFRAVGEAATRLNSTDPVLLAAYMRTADFALAGFKGRKLSFRRWNGQMRQPIPLVHPGATVALAPVEGFLHRRTELDTLGLDRAETDCGDR